MERSSNLNTRLQSTLEKYLEGDESLITLKNFLSSFLSKKDLEGLGFPQNNKSTIVRNIINYFLAENLPQRAYHFLSLIETLREGLDPADDLRPDFNNCYNNLKKEILWIAIASLYRDVPAFYITVNEESLNPEAVRVLAETLSEDEYAFIRRQLLHLLSHHASTFTSHTIDGYVSSDDPSHRWKGIVEEIIIILRTCFTHADDKEYDMEFVAIRHISKVEWLRFYKEVVCNKLLHKKITHTPLNHLQEILSHAGLSKQDLSDAYVASLSNQPSFETIPISSTLMLMLQNLTEVEVVFDSIPIIKFVEHLIYDLENRGSSHVRDQLKEWNENMIHLFSRDGEWLHELRQQVQKEVNRSMYLLIVVKPTHEQSMAEAEEKQMFRVQAWLEDDEHKIIADSKKNKDVVSFDNIPMCIDKIRAKFSHYLARIAVVELFLPKNLLSRDIHLWQIKVGEATAQFVAEHTWVVRSLERAEKSDLIEYKWKAKWKNFQNYGVNDRTDPFVHIYTQVDCNNKDGFYKLLRPDTIFCIALDFVPPAPHTTHIFTKIFDAGVPIIFWRRQETHNPALKSFSEWFPEWLETLIKKNGKPLTENLKNLPFLIWEERRSAERDNDHIYHLVLLWDDPNRLPPLSIRKKVGA